MTLSVVITVSIIVVYADVMNVVVIAFNQGTKIKQRTTSSSMAIAVITAARR